MERDPSERGSGRPRILVVEDDAEVRDLETFLLESEEYDVTPVVNGDDALRAIRASPPNLVLLDFLLPGKDANDVLDELATDPATSRVPVLVVSGYRERLRSFPQVRGVIPKPFSVTELLDAVRRECPEPA